MRIPRTFTAAAIILAAVFLVDLRAHAEDIAVPKQEFKTREEFAKYREAAWAHFQKRCKEKAGETISRTVDNVRGLLLLKPRRQATEAELRDQFWRGDPYGHDSMLPDSEIGNFLRYLNERDVPTIRRTSRPGFSYVEAKDALRGYLRYELDGLDSKIVETTIDKPMSRFGVTWEDISTDEDRQFWVAGGKLQVLDLETNEILGFRTGYLIEFGFGSRGGGRRPWLHARLTGSDRAACPPFPSKTLVPINRLFVEKVLGANTVRMGAPVSFARQALGSNGRAYLGLRHGQTGDDKVSERSSVRQGDLRTYIQRKLT